MKTKINNSRLKAVSTLAAAVTIVGFPMLTAAEAAPPSHAPAHGYYKNKDKKNKNKGNRRDRREDRRERRQERREDRRERRDDRYDDRRDDRRDRWDDRDNVTGRVDVYGIVVGGSYRSRLTVRGEDGRTYVVEGNNDFDSRINIGDRVRVVGEGRGSTVLAERVTLVDNRR